MAENSINYQDLKQYWKNRQREMYELHEPRNGEQGLSYRKIGRMYNNISAQAVANAIKSYKKSAGIA